MKVTVNGAEREIAPASSLADVLTALGMPERGIAVARNDAVVRRGEFAQTLLREGDRIEIIQAVAGG